MAVRDGCRLPGRHQNERGFAIYYLLFTIYLCAEASLPNLDGKLDEVTGVRDIPQR
jgi:hypothetical protein